MPVGSKELTPEQLRGLESEPLADALAEAKRELFNLRFQSATGQLESHGRLRAVKKDIARIYTEMRERELGIGREPVAAAVTAGASSDDDADVEAEETTTDSEKGA